MSEKGNIADPSQPVDPQPNHEVKPPETPAIPEPTPPNAAVPEAVIDKSLDHILNLKLTKQEWIVVFNLLRQTPVPGVDIGVARLLKSNRMKLDKVTQVVVDILDQIEPYIAVFSSVDVKKDDKKPDLNIN